MNFKEKLGSIAKKSGVLLKKCSPELLVGAGIVGVVGAAVWACVSTTKVNDILEDHQIALDTVKANVTEDTDPKEYRKDVAGVYIHTGLEMARLYGPAVALGGLSIGCIVTSNHIHRKRNAALAGAYALEFNNFKKYRDKIIEKYGEDIDKEIRYGVKNEKFDKNVVDEKTGKEKKTKENVKLTEGIECDEYSVFFDELNPNYVKDAEYNLEFLRRKEEYANALLRRDKFISLNDVYDLIGAPRKECGQFIGWTYDPMDPADDIFKLPDGRIEKVNFGIIDINRAKTIDFIRGYEKAILLDFRNLDPEFLKNAKWGGNE